MDFAVVSTAVLLNMDNGVCIDSRIVLGAVAPGPSRTLEAEQFIKGKKLDAAIMEEAAELAVKGAKPLNQNGYKIEIVKNLVNRALISCSLNSHEYVH